LQSEVLFSYPLWQQTSTDLSKRNIGDETWNCSSKINSQNKLAKKFDVIARRVYIAVRQEKKQKRNKSGGADGD